MADTAGFTTLANLAGGSDELDLSNTSGSTDGIKAASFPGPLGWVGESAGRMLHMNIPASEKNNMQQLGTPGRVFTPMPAPRSSSPSTRVNPFAMGAGTREASPGSQIASPGM